MTVRRSRTHRHGHARRGSHAHETVATFALAALAALAGCTMIPPYQRPVAPVPDRFPAERDTASRASARGAAAELEWRSFFTDERLRTLIELALANNRDLRVAALNVEQSRAQYRITRSSSYPSVSADGALSAQRTLGLTTREWSADVGINAYELDFFGRVRSLNAQALEQYLATEQARRSAQIALIAEVATQYLALREAQEQLQLARATLTAVQGSYELNKFSYDAGQSNEQDLRTAEGQVQTATINVLTYELQVTQAGNALALLVGRPLPSELPAAQPFETTHMLADIPSGLPSDLVQHRPDILQAEHTLKAANANIGAARAAFFPSISLTAASGWASPQLSQLLGSGSDTWSFAPQISVPIFAGGQHRSTLEAAKASALIEVANYEKTIQTAFREVADALAAHGNYARQIEAETDAINTERRRLELATLRYRQGDDTYLNVLSAQQDLYGAQQGLLAAENNELASQVSLYRALGGGWK